jgi:hypothetical protein
LLKVRQLISAGLTIFTLFQSVMICGGWFGALWLSRGGWWVSVAYLEEGRAVYVEESLSDVDDKSEPKICLG